jgi:hypothetical protein
LSLANAKGKGTNGLGKEERRREEVRSPEEISKNLLGNLKIENSFL